MKDTVSSSARVMRTGCCPHDGSSKHKHRLIARYATEGREQITEMEAEAVHKFPAGSQQGKATYSVHK